MFTTLYETCFCFPKLSFVIEIILGEQSVRVKSILSSIKCSFDFHISPVPHPSSSIFLFGEIANMMLYHVPNLDKGLSEVKRILTREGYFYCATYGENGIIPFIVSLLKEYGIKDISELELLLKEKINYNNNKNTGNEISE